MNQTQEIPAGWKMVQISDICKILSGSTPKTSESEYWDGSIPWFTPLDLSQIRSRYVKASDRKITEEGFNSCSAQKIPQRSLIMSSRAPIGYFAINLEEATTNQGCKTFVCSKEVNVDFLYYYLNCYIDQIKRLGSGSTFAEVNKKQLESLEVVIPPFSEQNRIATILSKVDEEIEKVERIIWQTEKLKKGLMQKLLTKGIGHTKFKQSELGEIPEEWEVVRLSEAANVIDSLHKTPDFSEDGYAMVRVADIKPGFLILDKTQKVARDIFEEFTAKYRPQRNDIVLSRVGSYGVISYVDTDEPFCMGQNTVVLKPNINNLYLFYYLNHEQVQSQIENEVSGSGYKSLSLKSIRELNIALPKNIEQEYIAKVLSSLDAKIRNNIEVENHLIKLKKGLMNDLLSGKVRTI